MNIRSLRTRSLIAVLAVVLPALVVYAYLSHAHVSYQLGYRLDGRMKHELTMLKEAVTRSRGDNERLREIVEIMPIDSFPQRRLYGIWANGELLLATENFPFDAVPEVEAGYSNQQAAGIDWRVLLDFLPPSDETTGRNVAVIVADPMSARTALIRGGAIDTTLPVLIAVPILIIGIFFALHHSLKPLTHLAAEIRHRSPERLAPLESQGVPSEAMPIVESVNALMLRLADSLERERRFTADAAHELRTPLTALKAHAQVALRADDDALRRETLQSIARTVNRTDRMISQLLALARLDPQQNRLDAEVVDLGKILTSTAEELQPLAEARNKAFRFDCQPDVSVRGSSTALAILVRNLLENALQYSNEGEPVELRVAREDDKALLQVIDSGPGIPAAARPEVFERFRRLPDSQASGTGLGLSIVQRVAELHGATVALDDANPHSGLKVTVRFPHHGAS